MSGPIYDADQPAPFDTYAQSQPNFLANFSTLYNAFMVNHVALDAASNAGNHSVVQLLELDQGTQNGPSDISFYTKLVTGQTDQLFMRYPGNGVEVQLTGYQIYGIKPISGNVVKQFFTYIPGGSIIYFGQMLLGSAAGATIPLQPAICKNIVSVALSLVGTTASQKPWVDLNNSGSGIWTGVNLHFPGTLAQTYNYVIWGNP